MANEETAATAKRQKHLKHHGPIISVQLERPPDGSGSWPPPLDVTALIDTGAGMVAIQAGVAEELGLEAIGSTTISTPTHEGYPATMYRIRLTFTAGFYLELEAVEVPLHPGIPSYRCLIGRNVLKHAQFTYDGLSGTFSLTFKG